MDDIVKKLKEEIGKNLKREKKGNNNEKTRISTEDARALIEIVEKIKVGMIE